MKFWSAKELLDYKVDIERRLEEVRKKRKWYHSKETKDMYDSITDILVNENTRINQEIIRRLGINVKKDRRDGKKPSYSDIYDMY